MKLKDLEKKSIHECVIDLSDENPAELAAKIVRNQCKLDCNIFDLNKIDDWSTIYIKRDIGERSGVNWYEAVIILRFEGVVFYQIRDYSGKVLPISHFDEGSVVWRSLIYPMKIILPKELEVMFKLMNCDCGLTKIEYKEHNNEQ